MWFAIKTIKIKLEDVQNEMNFFIIIEIDGEKTLIKVINDKKSQRKNRLEITEVYNGF